MMCLYIKYKEHHIFSTLSFASFSINLLNFTFLGYPYHTEELTCLAINSTSTIALTGSEDGSVHMVNIHTGRVCIFITFDI